VFEDQRPRVLSSILFQNVVCPVFLLLKDTNNVFIETLFSEENTEFFEIKNTFVKPVYSIREYTTPRGHFDPDSRTIHQKKECM
jgi:hypothetical protein